MATNGATMRARAPTFIEEVIAETPGDSRLEMCIQCGSCGGSCPSGPDMDHTPRALFAMVEAAGKYGRYDPATGMLPDLPPAT